MTDLIGRLTKRLQVARVKLAWRLLPVNGGKLVANRNVRTFTTPKAEVSLVFRDRTKPDGYFLENPGQWELFKAERPDTAADEIVRWATPVTVFQRTALADTTLGGQQISTGQRVGLFYRSANFDEDVFDHPERFDIRRSPNPHLGFGGSGAHFCLGASLARLEIDLIFNAIADHMPGIRLAGEPRRLRSGWLNGMKRLPVQYS